MYLNKLTQDKQWTRWSSLMLNSKPQINKNTFHSITLALTLTQNCHYTIAKPVCPVDRRGKTRVCISTSVQVFTTALLRSRYLDLYTVKANREAIRSVHRELLLYAYEMEWLRWVRYHHYVKVTVWCEVSWPVKLHSTDSLEETQNRPTAFPGVHF